MHVPCLSQHPPPFHTHTDILSHIHSVRKLICQIVNFSCSFKDLAQSSPAQSESCPAGHFCVRTRSSACRLTAGHLCNACYWSGMRLGRSHCNGCSEVRAGQSEVLCACVRERKGKLSDIKMICCYVHIKTLATECDDNNSNLCPLLKSNGWSWFFCLEMNKNMTMNMAGQGWLFTKKEWWNKMKTHRSHLVHWPYAESTAGFCLRVVAKTSTKKKNIWLKDHSYNCIYTVLIHYQFISFSHFFNDH